LQPERLTDIEMVFRNLDMTALSPCAIRFAGYRIVSGRLSLDLQYQVRQGPLLGEKKVVLNKVGTPCASFFRRAATTCGAGTCCRCFQRSHTDTAAVGAPGSWRNWVPDANERSFWSSPARTAACHSRG